MSSSKEDVVESHLRYVGTAQLFINLDASWSVGLDTKSLVKVQFGSLASIDDDSFGFSAIGVEKAEGGGYKLYAQSDADENTIVEVAVNAAGVVDAASLKVLSNEQIYQLEALYNVDMNDSGGVGGEPVALQGGPATLFAGANGTYQVGASAASVKAITVGGAPLTNKLLPAGWKIVEVTPSASGFELFAKAPSGDVFGAKLNANGEYQGGEALGAAALAATETRLGVDLNGDKNVPAPAGWTSVLKNPAIKAAVEGATAAGGRMGYEQLVGLMNGIIAAHKAAGDSPVSADELADLQALASRGKNIFGTAADASSSDYLSFIFSGLADGSPANLSYTGGQAKAMPLGNLVAGSTLGTLEKLVDKWLLGGDMPAPTAGGDAATGKAQTTVGTYAKASGALYVDGIAPADIKQGQVGDCFLAAALVTIADVKPDAIRAMILDNGNHTWGVRFFDAQGKANWVTVNDMLPVSDTQSNALIYGGNPTASLTGELWFPLIEKAYAQANALKILPRSEQAGVNGYWGIEGGFGDPMANVLGGKVTTYTYIPNVSYGANDYLTIKFVDRTDPAAMAELTATLTAALNGGKSIWLGSDKKTTDTFNNTLLTGGHAFAAIDADKADPNSTGVAVWNPWGFKELPTPAAEVGYLSPFVTYDLAALIGIPEINFMVGG